MNLYAAYIGGVLLSQVAAESEDTAISKLRMDYPKLEGEVTFEIIDPNYEEPKEEEEEKTSLAAVVTEEETEKETSDDKRQFSVIEADAIEINITVNSQSLSKEDIDELTKSAEQGLVIAKKKGN